MSMGTAETTMFVPKDWSEEQYNATCLEKYGITPAYNWAWDTFGGIDVAQDFRQYSNIVFSNGDLDPWYAGGVTKWIHWNLPFQIIRGGAHHLDLRTPNDADVEDVKWVRRQHMDLMRQWIGDYENMEEIKSEIAWN